MFSFSQDIVVCGPYGATTFVGMNGTKWGFITYESMQKIYKNLMYVFKYFVIDTNCGNMQLCEDQSMRI